MKFRFYQLLYVAVIAMLVVALMKPVMKFYEPDGVTALMDNYSYVMEGESTSVVALAVVLIAAVAVNVFAAFVSLFSNFALQKRSTILSMLLLAGYYVLLLIYSFILIEGAAADMLKAMFIPVIALATNAAAFILVRKQEAKIIAKALGFRLRD